LPCVEVGVGRGRDGSLRRPYRMAAGGGRVAGPVGRGVALGLVLACVGGDRDRRGVGGRVCLLAVVGLFGGRASRVGVL
jgi:hypothetical protein